MDAGRFVTALRERHALSQQQLAYRAGSNQQAISRIERGVVSPTVEMLERLATCCGEELVLDTRATFFPFDEVQLAEHAELPIEQRLTLALNWNRFAAAITGVGLAALRDVEG